MEAIVYSHERGIQDWSKQNQQFTKSVMKTFSDNIPPMNCAPVGPMLLAVKSTMRIVAFFWKKNNESVLYSCIS